MEPARSSQNDIVPNFAIVIVRGEIYILAKSTLLGTVHFLRVNGRAIEKNKGKEGGGGGAAT